MRGMERRSEIALQARVQAGRANGFSGCPLGLGRLDFSGEEHLPLDCDSHLNLSFNNDTIQAFCDHRLGSGAEAGKCRVLQNFRS